MFIHGPDIFCVCVNFIMLWVVSSVANFINTAFGLVKTFSNNILLNNSFIVIILLHSCEYLSKFLLNTIVFVILFHSDFKKIMITCFTLPKSKTCYDLLYIY